MRRRGQLSELDPALDARTAMADSVIDLFAREYKPMVRLAYVMMHNQHDAEEIVQDAFLEVQKVWPSLLNPGGYLRTAVVNGARRRASRESNRRRIVDRNTSTLHQPTALDQQDNYLLDALATLPERQRIAVQLAYFGGYRAVDIAEILDCRTGAAKSLVHRGVKRLRKELAP